MSAKFKMKFVQIKLALSIGFFKDYGLNRIPTAAQSVYKEGLLVWWSTVFDCTYRLLKVELQILLLFRMRLLALLSVFVFSVTCTNTAQEKEEIPYDIQDPRLFATTTTTTTTTVTVASTIPCTSGEFAGLADQAAVDALAKCPISLGRRRRGVLFEEDDEEQFSINPSAIQG